MIETLLSRLDAKKAEEEKSNLSSYTLAYCVLNKVEVQTNLIQPCIYNILKIPPHAKEMIEIMSFFFILLLLLLSEGCFIINIHLFNIVNPALMHSKLKLYPSHHSSFHFAAFGMHAECLHIHPL